MHWKMYFLLLLKLFVYFIYYLQTTISYQVYGEQSQNYINILFKHSCSIKAQNKTVMFTVFVKMSSFGCNAGFLSLVP